MNDKILSGNDVSEGESRPPTDVHEEHSETAELAYFLWKNRGCPEHTPDEDWFEAERQLAARAAADGAS